MVRTASFAWQARGLTEPAIADRIRDLGGEPMVMSPRELDAFVAADTERWAKAVKFCGAKVE